MRLTRQQGFGAALATACGVATFTACSSGAASERVLGVENACDVDVEVAVNEDPAVEQTQDRWVLVTPGELETVAHVDAPRVALFVRTPDAAEGQVFEYATDDMIEVIDGPVDLLIRVTNAFCPA